MSAPGGAPSEVAHLTRKARVRVVWQRLGALGWYYVVVALDDVLVGR